MFAKKIRLVFAVTAVLVLTTLTTNAKSNASNGNSIEGTWEVTVNLINPPQGFPQSFRALETYSRSGGVVTANNMFPNAGQGSWEKNGNRYVVTIVYFTFDETGIHNGSIEVRHIIRHNGKNNYTGEGVAEFRDASEQVLFSIPFTTEGRRIVPETP